jgi:predicted amidohydrolase
MKSGNRESEKAVVASGRHGRMQRRDFVRVAGLGVAAIPSLAVGEVTLPLLLAGLQMNVTKDIKKNRENIMAGIDQAAQAGASFLITPEGSLSGYTSDFDQNELTGALQEVVAEAANKKVGLMLGTCCRELKKGKQFCFNQVRVYAPEGHFLGAHSKILRCSSLDLPGTGEMVAYVEGELRTFDWRGHRFGILICNDLWATPGYTTMPNPYLPWKLKQMGAQFIVHCINSGTIQRYRPFHESSAELWALSLELPIVEVNAAREKEVINAQSGLIDATGKRSLRVPDSGLQFFTVKIDAATARGEAGVTAEADEPSTAAS